MENEKAENKEKDRKNSYRKLQINTRYDNNSIGNILNIRI